MLTNKTKSRPRKSSRRRSLLRRVTQSVLDIIAHTPVVYLIKQIVSSSDVKFLSASLFNLRVSRCVWLPLPIRWLLFVTVLLYILGEATILCSELLFPIAEDINAPDSSSDSEDGKDSDNDSTEGDRETEEDEEERRIARVASSPLSASRRRTKSPHPTRV